MIQASLTKTRSGDILFRDSSMEFDEDTWDIAPFQCYSYMWFDELAEWLQITDEGSSFNLFGIYYDD